MAITPTRGTIEVLKMHNVVLENLGTKLNNGKKQGDVCGDKAYNLTRRCRRLDNPPSHLDSLRHVRAHHDYEQRDHIDSLRYIEEKGIEKSTTNPLRHKEEWCETSRHRDERHDHFLEGDMPQHIATCPQSYGMPKE